MATTPSSRWATSADASTSSTQPRMSPPARPSRRALHRLQRLGLGLCGNKVFYISARTTGVSPGIQGLPPSECRSESRRHPADRRLRPHHGPDWSPGLAPPIAYDRRRRHGLHDRRLVEQSGRHRGTLRYNWNPATHTDLYVDELDAASNSPWRGHQSCRQARQDRSSLTEVGPDCCVPEIQSNAGTIPRHHLPAGLHLRRLQGRSLRSPHPGYRQHHPRPHRLRLL